MGNGIRSPDTDFLDSYRCQQEGSPPSLAWASSGEELNGSTNQASHGGEEGAEVLANPPTK